MKRKNSAPMIKALNVVAALALLVSLICLLIWGYTVTAISVIFASVCCFAAPVITSGGGYIEIFVDILESVAEGFMVIIDGIVNFFSSIF